MKITTSTDQSQQAIIITVDDPSAQTSFAFKVYTAMDGTPTTYNLSATEIAYLLANKIVYIPTLSVFTTFPADGYYYCKLEGNSVTSDWDSIVFTLTVRGLVYSKLSSVNPYAPNYNISDILHVCKLMLDEMEAMQYLDYSSQKKIDFTYRLQTLNEIL